MKPKSPSAPAPKPSPVVVEAPKLSDLANFYLIVTPGFEEIARAEVLEKWPDLAEGGRLKLEHGGLEVRCEIARGFAMNRELRTPTRVLLRLADFGCRDFPKLFKKMAGFPWESWLGKNARPEFQATSRRSWLKIKKRIEETCSDGFKKRMKSLDLKANGEREVVFDVNVRFDNDVCFVSLDTSGETLHKRGAKAIVAEAPLRETLAASLLRLMMEAGEWKPNSVELIDPMTGSGTFLLEAALLNETVRNREFAFEQMPLSRGLQKSHGNSRENSTEELGDVPAAQQTQNPFARFVGFEKDEAAAGFSRANLGPLLGDRKFELREEDFFEAMPLSDSSGLERWLIVNPPYGERLKIQGPLRDYYEGLFRAVERVVSPERMLFLLPAKVRPTSLAVPRAWKLHGRLPFLNGGVEVEALVFVRKS